MREAVTVTMRAYRFHELDVFASGLRSGNPLAVVHDAVGVSDEAMQEFARWTNFSETTFLVPPTVSGADYQVRIFTPASELPFAGHPTVGSAAAWLAAGGAPQQEGRVVQECGVGLVELRQQGDTIAFAAPPMIRSGPLEASELAEIVEVLQLDADDIVDSAWVDNGPNWRGVRLRSAEAVLAVEAPTGVHDGFHVGLVGRHPEGECSIEVRAFFNDSTGAVREDPVTGSLNASLAQWLLGEGVVSAPYVAAQGTCLGRAGRVYVHVDGDDIWIGGRAPIVVEGTVAL
jgi:PhzF family phenazine biosynthesis protein